MLQKISNHTFIVLILITMLAGLLRIPLLGTYPPALYSDEVNQGYNAYSVLRTGRDEHKALFPISFRSFGDWKPSMQTYLMIPTIAVFGLNSWGVRLPSAVLGTATIAIAYFLITELFGKNSQKLGLLSALLLAISPWHIHQSRMAMLTVVALFFLTLGVWAFLKGLKRPKWFVISAISFAFSVYSYYGMRVISPLVVIFLGVYFRKNIPWKDMWIRIGIGVGLVIMLPLLLAFIQSPDVVFGRAKTVSVFYDQGITLGLWESITQDGSASPPLVSRFFHNKPTLYFLDISRRFLSHLDGNFLFLTGDGHLPFQIPNMGVLYGIDSVFLIIGSLYLIKKRKKIYPIVIFWLFVAIFPSALTFLTPAANRSFNMIIPMVVITAYGLTVVYRSIGEKFRNIFFIGIALTYVISFSYFSYQYMHVLPNEHADWWLYGNKQLVQYVNKEMDNYDEVVISGKLSMPYIYFLFFNKTEPRSVWETTRRDLSPDEFGFEHVSRIKGIWFPRDFSWEKDFSKFSKTTLLVTTPKEEVGKQAELKDTIYYPNDEEAYRIYSVTHEIR